MWLVLIPQDNFEHAEALAADLKRLYPGTCVARVKDARFLDEERHWNWSVIVAGLCWLGIAVIVALLWVLPVLK